MSIRALDAEGRYSFLWESPLTWLNNLGFVQFGDFGYFLTTPQKTDGTVFLNSTSDVFPIAYSLVGAGLVAYVGESPETSQRHGKNTFPVICTKYTASTYTTNAKHLKAS